jgi:hypothetical protein
LIVYAFEQCNADQIQDCCNRYITCWYKARDRGDAQGAQACVDAYQKWQAQNYEAIERNSALCGADAASYVMWVNELGRNAAECECYLRAIQEYWKHWSNYLSAGPRQLAACPFDQNGRITR